jgi:SAM-dependent methyltransferase
MSRSRSSIFEEVAAPAPRYLMRLAVLEQLLNTLPEPPTRFLEIGPGMGDVSLYLTRRFPEATGDLIDFSPDCTKVLRTRFRQIPRLHVRDGDFRELPEADRYDLIVACEVFEHLEDDRSGFAAVKRLLRPGGHFLFSAPAFMRKWQRVDDYAGHVRRYERRELLEKFASESFRVDQLYCYGFPVTALSFPLRQLYYLRRNRAEQLDALAATRRSGVDRSLAHSLRHLPWATLLRPFFFMQNLARDTDAGDGFIVLADAAPANLNTSA